MFVLSNITLLRNRKKYLKRKMTFVEKSVTMYRMNLLFIFTNFKMNFTKKMPFN